MSEPAEPTPAEERAAIRRRWITLGEVLGVVAVVISALTLWNAYSDRTHKEANRLADAAKQAARTQTLLLKAVPADDGRRLDLAPLDPMQTIQGLTIVFPTALGAAPAETTGDARIEARWFDDGLRKARKAKGRPDATNGDERVPIQITTRYLADGAAHTDVALYDLGYVLEGRLIGSSAVRLRGLSLIERSSAKAASARLDALWKGR
jgi:hypothetical protein